MPRSEEPAADKRFSEDDFIVDYHYGDSVSNDEEVASLSARLQRGKVSVSVGASSDSSYPSTNSEFSTPEAADDLPKFVRKPPPGVSRCQSNLKLQLWENVLVFKTH
jgi:hypothetical protein